MSEVMEAAIAPRAGYGSYILRTGKGVVSDIELLYGAYWYRTRFAGLRPILDLGPGRCWFTKQNVEDIVAVDNAPDLVEHYRQEGINIHLGDAYKIPFPDEYFEGLFCCWLLEHLTDSTAAMQEIYRVMKPGGYACLAVPTPNDMVAFYDDYTHVRPFTPASLAQLADDNRFKKHRIEYLPWARGLKAIVHMFGSSGGSVYFRLCDTFLRRLRLVNRNNLMLEVWK